MSIRAEFEAIGSSPDVARAGPKIRVSFTNPTETVGFAADPDDNIDPDDHTLAVMRQSNDFGPPPEMPATWWTRLLYDPPDTVVSPEDVRLVLLHIRHRLTGQEGTRNAQAPPQSADIARLPPREGDDSQDGLESYAAGSAEAVTTIAALHEEIEARFGPAGWTALVECWQESTGIGQPKRQPKTDDDPILAAEPDGKPDTPLPPLPANAPVLEEGLHRELPSMPDRVAAFLLHTPPDPPPWQYQESEGERAEREALESLGVWTG